MLTPQELDAILKRIHAGSATEADLAVYRSLQQSDENVQIGMPQEPVNFNIEKVEGQDIQFGDRNFITIEQILGQKIIYLSVDEIKIRELIQSSPYKGLKKFEPEDKDRFFGRDQFIKELANELEQTNLILLLGASGSGKSSVVRAGLLSWLSKKWVSRLVSLTFTPDQDPFESLYASLLRYYKQAEAQVARDGRDDTLTQVVTTLRRSDAYWFIFIDQFEELFTTSQADKRDGSGATTKGEQFIASLIQLNSALKSMGAAKDCPVKVVATMRADFFDRLSPYPALVKATDKHRPFIAEMQSDELRQAIEQPAALHGVVFETGLVEEITKDVQGQAGYLPLLQYTLNLLWETEVQNGSIHDRTLNLRTYRELGGVRGALQKHVDHIYAALPAAEQLAAQRIFLKLVEIGGDGEAGAEWKPVRRRALRSEFDSELEQRVLVKLIDENLLVSDQQQQAQESTVEIAHEALLTSWETLNTWIQENRQAIALRNRLNDDIARWQTKKAEEELWTGSKLEQVLELKKDPTFNKVLGGFSATANQFIDSSLGLRDRIRKRTILGLSSGLGIAMFLACIALWQGQRAETERQIAFASQLATQAQLTQNEEPNLLQRSALLAIESMRRFQKLGIRSLQADQALRQALVLLPRPVGQATYKVRKTEGIYSLIPSSDGKHVVTLSETTVQRVEVSTGKEDFKLEFEQESKAVLSPDGDYVAITDKDNTVHIWALSKNREVSKVLSSTVVEGIIFSPNSQYIGIESGEGTKQILRLTEKEGATKISILTSNKSRLIFISSDGEYGITQSGSNIQVVSLADRKLLSQMEIIEEETVFVSDNGKYLATAYIGASDKPIQAFEVRTGQKIMNLEGIGWLATATISPDGKYIATGDRNGGATVLDTVSGREITKVKHGSGWLGKVIFSPTGESFATSGTGNNNKLIRIYNASDGREVTRMLQEEDDIGNFSFSSNGKYLAVASVNRKEVLNDKDSSKEVKLNVWNASSDYKISSQAASIRFNSDEKLLVSTSDEAISVRGVTDGHEIMHRMMKNLLTSVFSPSDNYLALVSKDSKTVQILNVLTNQIVSELNHDTPVSSIIGFSNDGVYLTTTDQSTIRIWEVKGGREVSHKEKMGFQEASGDVVSVDGNYAVTDSSLGGSVQRLPDRIKIIQIPKKQNGANPRSSTFSPDGKYVAVSGGKSMADSDQNSDGFMYVWSLPDGKEVMQLSLERAIDRIVFSPDGKYIAVAVGDGTIRLWKLSSGEEVSRIQNKGASDIAFSANGKHLVTRDNWGDVRIWLREPDDLVNEVCSRLTRNLTKDEWQQYLGNTPFQETCPNPSSSDNFLNNIYTIYTASNLPANEPHTLKSETISPNLSVKPSSNAVSTPLSESKKVLPNTLPKFSDKLQPSTSPTLDEPERISFDKGGIETTIQDRSTINRIKQYLLWCKKGQRMTIQIKRGDLKVTVIAPDGQILGTADSTKQWQGQLPNDGDYTVKVSGSTESDYTVRVEIL